MNTLFTSDTHFGHKNIIGYSRNNKWESVEEMNEELVKNWNSVVSKGDRVYHLGDFGWYPRHGLEVRKRLNGHIRLIIGNHDDVMVYANSGMFQKLYLWRHFEKDHIPGLEFSFTATHIPLMRSQFRHGHIFNVHGHVHQNTLDSLHHINICVEQTNYTPISLEDLNSELKRRSELIQETFHDLSDLR